MIRAVLDTNVVVSSLLKPGGMPGLVLDAMMAGTFTPVVCDAILVEYRQVLHRDKFAFPPQLVDGLVDYLAAIAMHTLPIPCAEPFADEGDRVFWQAAVAADAYVVTGNLRHFPDSDRVMSPRAFHDLLAQTRSGAA